MGLTALIVVVVLLHQTCNTSAEDHCPPSSCGSFLDISYPFRLTSDPKKCGDQRYSLSCKNNQTLVLFLYRRRYHLRQINYTDYTIRVVDPSIGLNANKHSFNIPRYSLDYTNFSSGDPYELQSVGMIFVKCEKPVNSRYHLNISACIKDEVYSNSKRYTYALFKVDDYVAMELGDLCQVEQVFPTSRLDRYYYDDLKNISCIHFHNGLLWGFELSWNDTMYPAYEANNVSFSSNEANNVTCSSNGALISKLKIAGVILGPYLILVFILALYYFYTYDKEEKEHRAKIEMFLEDYRNFKPTRYSYADIKKITNQFIEKLGEGAYGTVFKGKLSNEIHVAVKILNTSMGNGEEFINEVGTMARIYHVNVVRLVGYCADGFRRALVYDFLPNDSLDKFISSTPVKNRILNWVKLHDIAFGVAKGIEYLHQGCDQQILHFDIKPHNVLLDQNFNPKISDFGLAKLCSKDQSAVSMTTARGTVGYIAPEVFSRNFGNVSTKADVYSFGILLLEIVGRRKNVDVTVENTSQVYFPEWIYNLLEQKEDIRIFVEDDGDAKIAKKLAIVGLWCIQWHPMDRPSIKNVVQMLEGEGDKLTMPPNPFASAGPIKTRENMPTKRLNNELEVIPESE